jgi:hypothetical protein
MCSHEMMQIFLVDMEKKIALWLKTHGMRFLSAFSNEFFAFYAFYMLRINIINY